MCPYDSCRLLAINLYSYVKKPFTAKAEFDFELFTKHVHLAQRFMDDIIDLELEKIEKILAKIENDQEEDIIKEVERNLWLKVKEKALQGRRTGLGVTAEGDMLAALDLTYGTVEATAFATKVHQTLSTEAYWSSTILAEERGAFPIYDAEREKEAPFVQRMVEHKPALKERLMKFGRRNITLLTIAPTGCLVEDTKIKTDRGELTLAQLFLVNGYDLEKFRGLKNIWLDINQDIYVENVNGDKNKITKLYWNGESETKKLTLENDVVVESTIEHKFLVKKNEKEAVWKKANELKVGDKILRKNK